MSAETMTTKTLNRDELELAERRARHFWVSLIVGLLGLQVAGGITAIFLSVSDPAMAIVPNYHQAALNWDASHRAHQLTQQLGWQIHPTVGARDDAAGSRTVSFEFLDKAGQPVSGLNIGASIYHHARGAVVERLRLTETQAGVYAAESRLERSGLWQVSLQIEGAHGTATETYELNAK